MALQTNENSTLKNRNVQQNFFSPLYFFQNVEGGGEEIVIKESTNFVITPPPKKNKKQPQQQTKKHTEQQQKQTRTHFVIIINNNSNNKQTKTHVPFNNYVGAYKRSLAVNRKEYPVGWRQRLFFLALVLLPYVQGHIPITALT